MRSHSSLVHGECQRELHAYLPAQLLEQGRHALPSHEGLLTFGNTLYRTGLKSVLLSVLSAWENMNKGHLIHPHHDTLFTFSN